MIKHIILLAFLISPAFSYAQENRTNLLNDKGQKTGFWLVLDKDGRKIYEGNFIDGHPIDTLKRFYPDGTTKAIMIYDKTGTKVNAEIFDEEGKLRAKGNYLDKQKNGIWFFYGSRKNLMIEIEYKKDLTDGHGIRYYANGDIMERTNWKKGIMHGIQQVYMEGGIKSSEFFYDMGQLDGPYIIYYAEGDLALKGVYQQNKKEGDWIYYLRGGKIDYTLNYVNGKVSNKETLDQRQKEIFDHYDKLKGKIKDPNMYLSDPESYFRK